jgi:phospholipid transport system substrate-binding protein
MMEFTVKNTLLSLIILAFASALNPAFAQDPQEQVAQAIVELEAGLNGRKDELRDDSEALYKMVNDILLPRFNRRYSAQLVLGKNWKAADAAQRERFIEGFYNSLLRKYAEGVLEFDADRVQLLPFRGDLSKKRTIVKTNVFLDDGIKLAVNYGFADRGDGWQMFDVTIDGISFIRNYRVEVDSEIRQTSLDAVIERLEAEALSATSGDSIAGADE